MQPTPRTTTVRSPRPRRRGAGLAGLGVVAALVVAGCTPAETGGVAAPDPTGTSTSPAASGPPSPPPGETGEAAPGLNVDERRTVAEGLATPWAIGFLPDGSALVSERDSGRLVKIDPTSGDETEIATIEDVEHGGEGGLLGLAVSPSFADDQRIFVYFTSDSDNRIASYRLENDELSDRQIIFEGIGSARTHNGGRIAFGPDGYLYVGTGDAQDQPSSQDEESLNGKILRITAEGDPAPDNPFGDSAVYSIGHRNVQGLAWDDEGRLWASEFGPQVDDEVNLIEPGANYGWPEVTGAPGEDGFVDAKVVWQPAEASPSGAAIIGSELYVGALRGERLWRVPLQGENVGEPQALLEGEYGRLRDVAHAPDGGLWLLTNQGDDSKVIAIPAAS